MPVAIEFERANDIGSVELFEPVRPGQDGPYTLERARRAARVGPPPRTFDGQKGAPFEQCQGARNTIEYVPPVATVEFAIAPIVVVQRQPADDAFRLRYQLFAKA